MLKMKYNGVMASLNTPRRTPNSQDFLHDIEGLMPNDVVRSTRDVVRIAMIAVLSKVPGIMKIIRDRSLTEKLTEDIGDTTRLELAKDINDKSKLIGVLREIHPHIPVEFQKELQDSIQAVLQPNAPAPTTAPTTAPENPAIAPVQDPNVATAVNSTPTNAPAQMPQQPQTPSAPPKTSLWNKVGKGFKWIGNKSMHWGGEFVNWGEKTSFNAFNPNFFGRPSNWFRK